MELYMPILKPIEGILDEITGAYKDLNQVMMNQKGLVDVVHTLKPVVCVKG